MTLPGRFDLPADFAGLAHLIEERLSAAAHGHMPDWHVALRSLPVLPAVSTTWGSAVTVEGPASAADRECLSRALHALHPWRKGPFSLFGVHIDSEWRSDWKWSRVAPHVELAGHRVLDVGGGNGYFGWRMLAAGASEVVGVDPTLVFCLQHLAVNAYVGCPVNHVLPLRLEEIPSCEFDTVFSMGVIYHRRDPAGHAVRLFRHTRPGGTVVIESIVVDGASGLRPEGRYARMRNVRVIPCVGELEDWLGQAGFIDVVAVDVTTTTVQEQRSTEWMTFQSLAQALDPVDPRRTVEGHPAPRRAIVTGRKPV